MVGGLSGYSGWNIAESGVKHNQSIIHLVTWPLWILCLISSSWNTVQVTLNNNQLIDQPIILQAATKFEKER
jgi:hypothetical protein